VRQGKNADELEKVMNQAESPKLPVQVWSNPSSKPSAPSLVHLTKDTLSLAFLPAIDLGTALAALQSGLALSAQQIALTAITLVQGEQEKSELRVHFMPEKRQSESVLIPFADGTQRDEFLNTLTKQLGSGWILTREPRKFKGWFDFSKPLSMMGGMAIVTWAAYYEAQRVAAGDHLQPHGRYNFSMKLLHAALEWINGFFGPSGVLLLGLFLVFVYSGWVFYGLAHNEVCITLEPDDLSRLSHRVGRFIRTVFDWLRRPLPSKVDRRQVQSKRDAGESDQRTQLLVRTSAESQEGTVPSPPSG
jgi:hypothetical protein